MVPQLKVTYPAIIHPGGRALRFSVTQMEQEEDMRRWEPVAIFSSPLFSPLFAPYQ